MTPADDLSVVEEKIYGAECLFSVLCYAARDSRKFLSRHTGDVFSLWIREV